MNFLSRFKPNARGFTLVEFIVILSIFAIMAAVALFNFNGFRSNVSLNNVAHDIALVIRQAQVFGWSTTSGAVSDPNQLERRAQGVFFDYDDAAATWSKEMALYSKTAAGDVVDAYYDAGYDTLVDILKIQGANRIADIRMASSRADLLIDPATGNYVSSAPVSITQDFSIAFSRPHPEANFFSSSAPLDGSTNNFAGIYVSAEATPAKLEHVIIISKLGEIEVQ